MATILLSAAGAAIGSSIGGTALGLSAAVIGRAAGATLGRVIDSRILGAGSPAVERGKVDRFRLTGASEGAAIATVHGRVRVAGQVIWASRFAERAAQSGGGGKGGPSAPTTTSYSYSISLAIALCEGQITRVGRVWADGNEISRSELTMRVYSGSEDQLPDPKIEAVEGAGDAPAYRGIAYVVIEDLELARFGNRVPAFSFEVMRTAEGDLADHVRAVAVIPGTGEYALATTPVHFEESPGLARSVNVHTPSGETDFTVSMEALNEELPRCQAASLVVSWFGDDLRCGSCTVRPKAEQVELDGVGMAWTVSGIGRSEAETVPFDGDRPVYGGTPSDASVIEAIDAMNGAGQAVMFYPFILMEQQTGNGLADPWTGAADQPVLPWRGRITTSIAPGREGSPDGTAVAEAEVAAFFGTAEAAEFEIGEAVTYVGSDTGGYRRFILHYAHLCALAGGVDAFCIGSEMRSLTQIRGAANSFPAVAALRTLAADVRGILGPSVRIGYAADWSEYFGYHPQDGSGDVFFHLDPLWADPAVDFVGIDNYMPLSDWRDGADHADAGWGSIYDPAYLKANIAGGEGFDWYYRTSEAEALQLRSPITDGAYDEPWVYRYKDLKGWWRNAHHERLGGVRQAVATDWQPEMKPVWFTEIGCAAIDKGTNEPNRFLDPKSSESSVPKYSNGGRDDLIQMQYLKAMAEFWGDPSNNPVSDVYGADMVDPARMFVWAWDARPYPFFPGNADVWSDGENYGRGHWLTGRATSRALANVVREICAEGGVSDVDTDGLYGVVRGFAPAPGDGARSRLQSLLLAHSADAVEKEGKLVFRNRNAVAPTRLTDDDLARGEGASLVSLTRSPEAEVSGRVRLNFIEADADYEVRAVDSIFPDEISRGIAESELALAMTSGEARATVDRWLSEARVSRDTASFALPPSRSISAGDIVRLETRAATGMYRVDRVEDAGLKQVEAVRVEAGIYEPGAVEASQPLVGPVPVALPVWARVLDLPAVPGDEEKFAPWVVATAKPWPGDVAVYSSRDGTSWRLDDVLSQPAAMGQTLNPLSVAAPGLWDRGSGLEVRLVHGALSSVDEPTLFAGGNTAVILDAAGTASELFQFRDAELVGPDTWSLAMRLRGQKGTDATMPTEWPAGSTVVVVDLALQQIAETPGLLEAARRYRIGPASKPVDHRAYVDITHQASGLALKPFRPARARAVRDAAGALNVTWIRRSRVDGDNWTLADVPLGEAFERYRIRVFAGGTLRREVVLTAPGWVYSAAEQNADGVGTACTIEVAQISDRLGPGHLARMEING